MGYRSVKRRWGTYWNTNEIYTERLPPDQVTEFLADSDAYYDNSPFYINVDGKEEDTTLGPSLCKAGCKKAKSQIFLAHMGPIPQFATPNGIEVESVSESNFIVFAETRLKAFGLIEETSHEEAIRDEISLRRSELTGTARGLLAYLNGQPAGAFWWYEEQRVIFLSLLGVLAPFRKKGVGRWLICERLQDSYERGYQYVILNVQTDNVDAIRLYRRLGFTCEIYWRGRYLFDKLKS
jgi:GNAT superfamily N-acetyltransferase